MVVVATEAEEGGGCNGGGGEGGGGEGGGDTDVEWMVRDCQVVGKAEETEVRLAERSEEQMEVMGRRGRRPQDLTRDVDHVNGAT